MPPRLGALVPLLSLYVIDAVQTRRSRIRGLVVTFPAPFPVGSRSASVNQLV